MKLEFIDGQSLWVKTEVVYLELHEGDRFQTLGLDSVTCWDLNNKDRRLKTRPGDYVEHLENRVNELEFRLKALMNQLNK